MALLTFTPTCPDSEMDQTIEPNMLVNSFNDGYEQAVPNGINNMLEMDSPKWTNLYDAEGQYIIDFLTNSKGQYFYWVPMTGMARKVFRCTSFTKNRKMGKRWNISATFKEAAGL